MKKLLFISNNQGKINEINSLLEKKLQILNLNDINLTVEIPENELTFEGNAKAKVTYVLNKFSMDCFADDSGLQIEALNMQPGVFSARFAGLPSNAKNNIALVLNKLENIENRNAQFITVICLYWNKTFHFFEGTCKGTITKEEKGENGFGYDPIFIPDGATKTFAEMDKIEKNKYSHRAKALQKMLVFLNSTL